jgi:cytochrome c oxidase subunit 2
MDDANPYGLDPRDPLGQDDILVSGNKMHLLIDQPIIALLRSKDVLHNFYVPEFRAKMDLVPGQITYFWFTPEVAGTFDILCAEYCGIGHYNMRGQVVVEDSKSYNQWLSKQTTFAESLTGGTVEVFVEQGERLAASRGCLACHCIDGGPSLGPGWQDLFGRSELLTDGTQVIADAEYLKESVVNPSAKLVEGYPPIMVAYPLSSEQLDSLVAYIQSLTSTTSNKE